MATPNLQAKNNFKQETNLNEIQQVLLKAQELLNGTSSIQSQQPQQQTFSNSSDLFKIKQEAAQKLQLSSITNLSGLDDNVSITSSTTSLRQQDLAIKDENQMLKSKLNSIRFELKTRDKIIDDLKLKISQVYVEVESFKLSKRNLETEKSLLLNEISLINEQKQRFYNDLLKATKLNDDLAKKSETVRHELNEKSSQVDRLKDENKLLNEQCVDTKVKALKEKEILLKNLEAIEADIQTREKSKYTQDYKQLVDKKSQIQNELENMKLKLNEMSQALIHEQNTNKTLNEKLNNYLIEKDEMSKEIEILKEKNLNSDIKLSNDKKEIQLLNKTKFKLLAELKKLKKISELPEPVPISEDNLHQKQQENDDDRQNYDVQSLKQTINKLNERIKELESGESLNESLTQNFNDWKESNKTLENHIISLQNEFDQKQVNIQHLQESLKQIENEKLSLENQIQIAQDTNENLTFNLNEWLIANEQLSNQIIKEQETFNSLNDNLNEWKLSNSKLENSSQKINSIATDNLSLVSVPEVNESFCNETDSWKELKVQNIDLISELDNLKYERDELVNENKTLQEKLNEFKILKSELDEKTDFAKSLTNEKAEIEGKIKSLENDILALQDLSSTLSNNLNEWNTVNDNLSAEILKEQDKFSILSENLNEWKVSNDALEQNTKEEAMHEEVTQFNENLNELKIKKEQLEAEINEVKKSLDDLSSLKQELTNNLNEWITTNGQVSSDILSEQDKYNKYNEDLKQLQEDIGTLNEKEKCFNEDRNKLQLKVKQLESEQISLDSQIASAQEFNENLTFNLNEWLIANEQLSNQILKEQETFNALSENLNEWKSSIVNLESQTGYSNGLLSPITESNLELLGSKERLDILGSIENLRKPIMETRECQTDEIQQEKNKDDLSLSDDAEKLNETLKVNLNQWTLANEQLSQDILKEQELFNSLSNNLIEWKESNIELQNKNINSKEFEDLENVKQQLQMDNIDLISQVDSLKIDVEELNNEIESLKQTKQDLIEKNEFLEAEVHNLKVPNEAVAQLIHLLNNFNYSINGFENNFNIKKKELHDRVINVQSSLDSFSSKYFNLKGKYDELLAEKSKLDQEYNALDTFKLQLECDLIKAQHDFEDLSKINSELKEQLSEKTSKVQNYESELSIMKENIQKSTTEEHNDEKQNEELTKLKLINIDLMAEIDTINLEKDDLTQQFEDLKQKFENYETLSDRTHKVDELKDEIFSLESNLESLLKKKEQIQVDIDKVQNELGVLENNILSTQELNSNLISNLNEWTISNDNLTSEILKEQEKYNILTQNLNEWKSSNEIIQLNVNSMQGQIDDQSNENLIEKQQIEHDSVKLQKEMDEIASEKDFLLTKISHARDQKVQIEHELAELQKEMDEIASEKDFLLTKISHARDQKVQMEHELAELRQSLDDSSSQKKILENNLNEWQKANDILSNTIIDEQEKFNESSELAKKLQQLENYETQAKVYQEKLSICENLLKNQKALIEKYEIEHGNHIDTYKNIVLNQKKLLSIYEEENKKMDKTLVNEMMVDSSTKKNLIFDIESDVNILKEFLNEISLPNTTKKDTSQVLIREYEDKIENLYKEIELKNDEIIQLKTKLDSIEQEKDKSNSCSVEESIDVIPQNITDANGLETLIQNYLNLIKTYKNLVLKSDLLNTQLTAIKTSYVQLFDKYKQIQSLSDINTMEDEPLTLESIENLVDTNKGLSDQVNNLKNAYSELIRIYNELKIKSNENYNTLHEKYLILLGGNSPSGSPPNVEQLTELKKKALYYKEKLTKQANELKQVKFQLKLTEEEIQFKSEQCSLAKGEIERMKSSEVDYKILIENLNGKLEAEMVEKESLKRKLSDFEMEINLLQDKFKTTSDQLESKQHEIETIKQQNQHNESKLSQEFNDLSEKNKGLKDKIDELNEKLQDLNRENLASNSLIEELKDALKQASTNKNESQSITNDLQNTNTELECLNIDLERIEKLVQDAELITSKPKPLETVQSCLKSLREQMSDLQSQVYDHAQNSSTWKYKLGFSCEKCEMKWEIEHHVMDFDQACKKPEAFLDTNFIRPVPKCNCNNMNKT